VRVGSPERGWAITRVERALPRARGFTVIVDVPRKELRGSPTCAWVHPPVVPEPMKGSRLSHVRVGSPGSLDGMEHEREALPRARGFTRVLARRKFRHAGSPTCAWVHRIPNVIKSATAGLSHVRVGSPMLRLAGHVEPRALPRARGFTALDRGAVVALDGSPTCAWVHRRSHRPPPRNQGLSHVRVGSPMPALVHQMSPLALPRARGFTREALVEHAAFAGAWVHPARSGRRPCRRRLSHVRVGSPSPSPSRRRARLPLPGRHAPRRLRAPGRRIEPAWNGAAECLIGFGPASVARFRPCGLSACPDAPKPLYGLPSKGPRPRPSLGRMKSKGGVAL
jgi:hypothetical protein